MRIFSSAPLHGLYPDQEPVSGSPAAFKSQKKSTHCFYILILFCFFGAGYHFLLFNRAVVELEVESNVRTIFKFYWPNTQGHYSEKNTVQFLLQPGRQQYRIYVTDRGKLDHLRVDPSENNQRANITIHRMVVQQTGYPDAILESKEDFLNLQPLADITSLTRHEGGGISMEIRTLDPQLRLDLPPTNKQIPWLDEAEHWLGILILAGLCYLLSHLFFRTVAFIPVFAVFALALTFVMAALSGFNTHPDESVHVAAGVYYRDHTLPPRIADPAIVHTYSPYGVSRLHSNEIYYPLAGKYLHFLNPFQLEPYVALRFFNVLLFFSLILYAFGKVDFRIFLLPLLLSPQIWYIFSYFNSDAFSLFVCLLAAYQLAAPHSSLNALLRDEPSRVGWLSPLLLGLLLSLLFLQKQNFYFLYIFFLFYFLWRIYWVRPMWTRRTKQRFVAILLVGASVALSCLLTDAWINDFNKKELALQAREDLAHHMYKPSTPLAEKNIYLHMRDRGLSLKHILNIERWGGKSFRTAFGVYGYTQYAAPFSYYDYVKVVGILLVLTLIVSVLFRGGSAGWLLLFTAGAYTACLLVGLIYHAWTMDFQPQGRYLLPLIPMFAILLYHFQNILFKTVFYSLFFVLFLLSVYNFVFVGLYDIGKAV
jgi:hypothetical protein